MHTKQSPKLLRTQGLDPSFYRARREAVTANLAPNSVAIVVSMPERIRNNDNEYAYRQSSDALYLSGFPEPQSVLILSNIEGEPGFTMLVQPKDKAREIWTGTRSGVEGALSDYQADAAHTIDEFDQVVRALVAKAETVYYKFGRNRQLDRRFKKIWLANQKPLMNPEGIIDELRVFKSPEEIELMRTAAEISALAHRQAMLKCKPGLKEFQLQAELEYVFRYHGASGPAYGSIVATGNNAVTLHYTRNTDELKDGDLLLIDAACEYAGYASDITRTFPVSGRFSKAQRQLYDLVLTAQTAGIEACKPGVTMASVHETARKVLCKGLVKLGILPKSALKELTGHRRRVKKAKSHKPALGDLFMHGTSHYLGLDVHDVGSYQTEDGTRSDKGQGKMRLLEPGMVITVEPGVYIDALDKRVAKRFRGIGIRIEDDVLITDSGHDVLSAGAPKGIEEIESLMATAQA